MSSHSSEALVESAPPPATTLTPRQVFVLIAILGLANCGVLMSSTTPQYISLALKLAVISPETATTDLSLLLGVGIAVQIAVLLLVGRLSDYTSSRLGMRRPWLIAGAIGIAVGGVLLGVATSLPMLWAGYLFLSVGTTSCVACLYATIADQIPEHHRGLAAGVTGAASALGSILGLFVVQLAPGNMFLIFVAPAIAAVVPLAVLIVVLRDRRLEERRPVTAAVVLGAFAINWRRSPSLAWFVPSIALVNTALAAAGSYAYYLLAMQLRMPEDELPTGTFWLQLLLNVVVFLVGLAIGPISDRIGRRKPFYAAGIVVFLIGLALVVVAQDFTVMLLGFGVLGLGSGFVISTYLTIAIDAMGDLSTSARDINVIAGCYTLPYAFLPLLAPMLLGAEGDDFTTLLIVAGVITLLAAVFLPKVKVR